jgi:hypothetical protein
MNPQLRAARFLVFGQAFDRSAPGRRWHLDELGRRLYRRAITRQNALEVVRVFAASGDPCLERGVTDRQSLRGAAHPMALSELDRQFPKFNRDWRCSVIEPAATRRTARSHAGVPLPCPPLLEPPSPSPPSFLKTRESTLTNRLRAVTQACRKDTFTSTEVAQRQPTLAQPFKAGTWRRVTSAVVAQRQPMLAQPFKAGSWRRVTSTEVAQRQPMLAQPFKLGRGAASRQPWSRSANRR